MNNFQNQNWQNLSTEIMAQHQNFLLSLEKKNEAIQILRFDAMMKIRIVKSKRRFSTAVTPAIAALSDMRKEVERSAIIYISSLPEDCVLCQKVNLTEEVLSKFPKPSKNFKKELLRAVYTVTASATSEQLSFKS
jgi:hypothetical protein